MIIFWFFVPQWQYQRGDLVSFLGYHILNLQCLSALTGSANFDRWSKGSLFSQRTVMMFILQLALNDLAETTIYHGDYTALLPFIRWHPLLRKSPTFSIRLSVCLSPYLSTYLPTYLPVCKYSIICQFQCILMSSYFKQWAVIHYLLYFDARGYPFKLSPVSFSHSPCILLRNVLSGAIRYFRLTLYVFHCRHGISPFSKHLFLSIKQWYEEPRSGCKMCSLQLGVSLLLCTLSRQSQG